jgi:hypothetical protein
VLDAGVGRERDQDVRLSWFRGSRRLRELLVHGEDADGDGNLLKRGPVRRLMAEIRIEYQQVIPGGLHGFLDRRQRGGRVVEDPPAKAAR